MPTPEEKFVQREARKNLIPLLILVFVASIGDIALTLSLDQFQRAFHDDLPGKELPELTLTIFAIKPLLWSLCFCWPVIGFIAFLMRNDKTLSQSLFYLALVCAIIYFATVGFAMWLPMQSGPSGMSAP